jgi:hypothetical protein
MPAVVTTDIACDGTRSWEGVPFDQRTGQRPKPTDTAPQRTAEGDFIVYHGTSLSGAEQIRTEGWLRPDDFNCVGFATTPGQAQVFAAIKHGVVLRVTLPLAALAARRVVREVGGSGRDQFLVLPQHGSGLHPRWPGLPVTQVELYEP